MKIWIGRVLSGLAIAFLAFDGITKVMRVQQVVDATVRLGYGFNAVPVVGALALIGMVLYAIPRTAPIGAVYLTGYLGGASATHLRAESGLFQVIFPALFGVIFVWGGLALRDARVRGLL